MAENCKNCNEMINANFCGNCGQKKFKRIDRKYLWDEIQYTFLHTNKGFLYSVKNILKNPGKTAREFIDGNRVNHYKPILLAFVLSGISAFISFKLIGLSKIMAGFYAENKVSSEFMNDYTTFFSSYNSAIMLLLIPLFALLTRLAFRKWGDNYYEHVVANAYFLCFYTLVSIILVYPVMYLLRDNPEHVMSLTSLYSLLSPLLLFWFFKEFYPAKPTRNILMRTLLLLVYMILGFMLLMVFVFIIGIIYARIIGPEALEYFKPR